MYRVFIILKYTLLFCFLCRSRVVYVFKLSIKPSPSVATRLSQLCMFSFRIDTLLHKPISFLENCTRCQKRLYLEVTCSKDKFLPRLGGTQNQRDVCNRPNFSLVKTLHVDTWSQRLIIFGYRCTFEPIATLTLFLLSLSPPPS